MAVSEGLPSEILTVTGHHYLCRRLAIGEGIVHLCVCVCVCCVTTALRICVGGKGNALYPLLCGSVLLLLL